MFNKEISKKLSVSLLSVLLIGLSNKFSLNLDDTAIASIAGVVSSYIIGQSFIDHKKEDRK